ncbi:MAG: response regulator transcription factor [Weeksellaceae bacterium]|nr:response regulator transcription factor [Weeksellaceae bacterium]
MKILLADDHPFTLNGIAHFLRTNGYDNLSLFSQGDQALTHLIFHQPDLAILDISMPGKSGIEILQDVQERNLKTKCILLTMHDEPVLYQQALNLGVVGYILKEDALSELIDCIETVCDGDVYYSKKLIQNTRGEDYALIKKLTQSEWRVIELVAQKHTNKEIAEALFISYRTVETHRRNIIEKLELPKQKNSLLIWALKNSENFPS